MDKFVATHRARGATTGHVSGVLVARGSLGAWCFLLILLKKLPIWILGRKLALHTIIGGLAAISAIFLSLFPQVLVD